MISAEQVTACETPPAGPKSNKDPLNNLKSNQSEHKTNIHTKTYNKNGYYTGNHCIPVAEDRCLADKNTIENEVAQTKLNPVLKESNNMYYFHLIL
jgi:hypothetical protein